LPEKDAVSGAVGVAEDVDEPPESSSQAVRVSALAAARATARAAIRDRPWGDGVLIY
jgi:hypothetical protein